MELTTVGGGAGEPRALLAVVPWTEEDGGTWEPADPQLGVTLVRHRDLAALVARASEAEPESNAAAAAATAHHWEVHRALLRGTVAPAPVGIVFASDQAVEAFLADSYGPLRSALARVEGRWEFRLHVHIADSALAETLALDLATHIYAELRRASRGAIPFPKGGRRVMSAAFLVERTRSTAFQNRVEELRRVNHGLELDLTGPWPPYDFVSMHA